MLGLRAMRLVLSTYAPVYTYDNTYQLVRLCPQASVYRCKKDDNLNKSQLSGRQHLTLFQMYFHKHNLQSRDYILGVFLASSYDLLILLCINIRKLSVLSDVCTSYLNLDNIVRSLVPGNSATLIRMTHNYNL